MQSPGYNALPMAYKTGAAHHFYLLKRKRFKIKEELGP